VPIIATGEAMTARAATYLNLRIAKSSHSHVYAQTPDPLTAVRDDLDNVT